MVISYSLVMSSPHYISLARANYIKCQRHRQVSKLEGKGGPGRRGGEGEGEEDPGGGGGKGEG